MGSHVATSIQEDCGSHYTQTIVVLAHYVPRSVLEMLVGLVLFPDLRPWTRPMLEWASIYVHMYSKKLHVGTGDVQIT